MILKDLNIALLLLFCVTLFSCNKKEDENKVEPPVVKEFNLTISHPTVNITKGSTFLLSVAISPETTEYPAVLWSSGNSSIATVSTNGLVEGLAVGETSIVAMFADSTKSVTSKIVVSNPSATQYTITLSKSEATITQGSVVKLVATISPQPDENIQLSWLSSNPNIATVSPNGEVKGISVGKSTITAKLSDGTESNTCTITVFASTTYDYKYRLILKDKGTSAYSTSRPEDFLTQRSVQRRNRQGIAIDNSDLPISDEYIKAIEEVGGTIVAKSKWLNTVCVHCAEPYFADEYKKLPFVEDAVLVWRGTRTAKQSSLSKAKLAAQKMNTPTSFNRMAAGDYGDAWSNIKLHNGDALHSSGFMGEGIEVAVIDGGFNNFQTIATAGNIKVKGAKSFIYNDSKVYNNTNNHGTWVTSCMAYNNTGVYVGSAPKASYWLLRSEDDSSEFPVEEDYWVAAIEYADSVGVDIANTSLGYERFDLSELNYKYSDTDGKTALMSRGADAAVAKGIFIVTSAGNTGSWVFTPGDAHNVLTVGSISLDGNIAGSSSRGYTADNRIKPDVVALGNPAYVIEVDGSVKPYGGTSFASPIMCGLVACLIQAYPTITTTELLDVIKKSGSRYSNPQLPFGYGIPDMRKAMQLAQDLANTK